MKRLVGRRSFRWIAIAGAFWLWWVGEAGAQCSITGPSTMCGSAELCGPAGSYNYEWSGPGGFTSSLQCVTVTSPGTYSLRVFDRVNGLWFGPCTHDLAAAVAPSCSITGADSVCPGGTAELCGPSGAAQYLWNGPNGFSASSPCVSVGEPGPYGLSVRETPDGCWSSPCEHLVNAGSCGGEPPTPPPPGENCPRSARWWGSQCDADNDDEQSIAPGGLAAIAGCANERAGLFSWPDPTSGLCSTLNDRRGLRQRATRQFAAALANVCAFTTPLPENASGHVGLDPNAVIHLEDLDPVSVAEWLAQTDQILIRMEGRAARGREARRAYRQIIAVGWAINHGHGVGPICGRKGTHLNAEEGVDSETLDGELAIEDGMPALEIESAAPNPFTLSARVVYYVAAPGGPVDIGVYDIAGRRVRSLVTGPSSPGRHEAAWDGRGDDGRPLLNGVYFVRGQSGVDQMQSRLTLIR